MTDVVLATHGLCKNFGALTACNKVSLDLKSGEIHALIGPNGAGKSTFIQLVSGSMRPDAGSIHLGGLDVAGFGTAQRARLGLGRTFQISSLAMEDTVLQNAILGALGAKKSIREYFGNVLQDKDLRASAEDALDRVGLLQSANKITSELSHGERRQLEVAVALTLEPKAFVMDEPMAGLGAGGSKRLTGFLDGLREQAPILLVEHDMQAVFALADRISVLVYGKLIATGSVDEIRTHPEVRRAYLGDDA